MLLKDKHARGSRMGATESNESHFTAVFTCLCLSESVSSNISGLPVTRQCWALVCLVTTDLCGLSVPRPRPRVLLSRSVALA